MTDKFRTYHIILVISSRRGIISVAIGGRGSRGTNEIAIRIVIIVVFRISTTIVVAVGIIIDIIFGTVIIVDGKIMAEAEAPFAIVILGVAFGCSRLASGEGTVMSHLKSRMVVAFEIIINVVF